jgi:hypothetical protein
MDRNDECPQEDKVMFPNGSTFDMASLLFSRDDTVVIDRCVRAWKSKKDNAARTWEEWVEIGWGLWIARREISRRTNDKTSGKRFNPIMGEWLKRMGLNDIDPGARSRLMKVMDQQPEISKWHAGLPIAQRIRCNHPDSVLSGYDKSLKTGLEPTKEKQSRKDFQIEELEQELAKAFAERDDWRTRAEKAEWDFAELKAAAKRMMEKQAVWEKRAKDAEADLAELSPGLHITMAAINRTAAKMRAAASAAAGDAAPDVETAAAETSPKRGRGRPRKPKPETTGVDDAPTAP